MKNLKIIVATFAMLISANFSYAQSIDEAAQKYAAAVEKIKSSSFAEAATLLKEALNMGIDLNEEGVDLVKEVQSLLPKVYLQYGVSELKTHNYEEAIKELLICEEMADLYGEVSTMRQASRIISGAYQMQGATAFNNKDYQTALNSFSKGYEQDPSNIKLAALTAKAYAELGQLDKALPIFSQVVEAGAKNSKYENDANAASADIAMYVGVAVSAAVEAGDISKAMELADLVPTNADIAMMVLQVANNNKQYQTVIARGQNAVSVQITDEAKSNAYYLLGIAYSNTGSIPMAIETLAKVTAGSNVAAAKTLITELKK